MSLKNQNSKVKIKIGKRSSSDGKNRLNEILDPDEKDLTIEQIVEKRISAWKRNPFEEDPKRLEFYTKRFGQKTTILRLAKLGLNKFPDSIRDLKEVIENIDLGENEIEELPDWTVELKNLKGINLENNKLKKLPDQIIELFQLRVIWLSINNLESLPEGLQKLPIKEIKLDGNPGLNLPPSILKRPPEEVLRYFFESRAEKGQPLLELKLLLVGRGKAGKTTLVKRLAGEEPSENEIETHSISIRELMLDCPKGKVRI
jgi:hypothetical protein